jgi:cell division protein FtsW
MLGLFCVLIFLQPDLGTAVGLVTTAGLLLLVAGMPLRYVGYASIVALPLLYWGLFHVNFRWDRLKVFLDPWGDAQGAGYQPVQSLYALGQGGVFGTGLGQSQQKLFFLPEAHTDFIFAIFGEEFGFIGAVALIGLFLVLLWRILRIALDCPTPFGAFVGLGIFFGLSIQVLMNLGVVVVLLPTKGLPLPFISLGGSNLFMSLVAVGTMLNIAQETS